METLMTIEDMVDSRYILPEDVIISPFLSLPKIARKGLKHGVDDYAVTRRHSRAHTKVVTKDAADLLEQFKTPRTLIDGVLAFTKAFGGDPMMVLGEVTPLLVSLVSEKCLAVEGSDDAKPVMPSFEPGDWFMNCEVLTCCQLLADTEVYQVRRSDSELLALKIARPDHAGDIMADLFSREQHILERLGGDPAPKLYKAGTYEGRPYLLMEWLGGLRLDHLIYMIRSEAESYQHNPAAPTILRKRLQIAGNLIDAYARLHAAGCTHGDPHDQNVVVLEDNSVRLLDFGWGHFTDEGNPPPRAGISYYYDPEFARFALDGETPPPANESAEQYSVAVMVHQLLNDENICHGRYLPFAMNQVEQFHQIVDEPALPLTSYFERFDPSIDAVILRALEKDPEDRFRSTADFHIAFLDAIEPTIRSETVPSSIVKLDESSNRQARAQYIVPFVKWSDPDASWFDVVFRRQPACSIKFGGAGIAYALYRLAVQRGDANLLSMADLWITKTVAHIPNSNAFLGDEIEINESTVGRVCPLHSESGVHLVNTLIRESLGDLDGRNAEIAKFVQTASSAPCPNLDLAVGRTGVLLGSAILAERFALARDVDLRPLIEMGDKVEATIWEEVNQFGTVREPAPPYNFGIAHGWAGLCYGTLRWHAAKGTPPPSHVESRLNELVELGVEYGKGLRWPYSLDQEQGGAGWCNGHAGFVFLWLEAARAFKSDRYLALAEAAALSVWQDRNTVLSLCCGTAGMAYALAEVSIATGDSRWLRKAHRLGQMAVEGAMSGYSLYKSMAGVAVMAADLQQPEYACFPAFGREP